MDKTSKKILEHLNNRGDANQHVWNYLYSEEEKEAEQLGMSVEDFNNTIEHLSDEGYIEYVYFSGSNARAGFKLTYQGLHYKEFRLDNIKSYIADKWIDFSALLVAFGAFIISCIALSRT